MASALVVRGTPLVRDPGAAPGDDDLGRLYGGDFLVYGERGAARVVPSARGEQQRVSLDGDDSDVVEMRMSDGSVLFQRAGSLAADLPPGSRDATSVLSQAARGASPGQVASVHRIEVALPSEVNAAIGVLNGTLPEVIDRDPLSRSAAAKVLDTVGSLLVDPAARRAALTLAQWIEKPAADDDPPQVLRCKPKKPGLYRVGESLELDPSQRLEKPPDGDGKRPWLLLVHGTFSHTEGAFSQLRRTREWQGLCRSFDGRILALEHPTLSKTPAENASDIANLLPEGAPLSVVSHSRGGLVGDVLSLAATQNPVLSTYSGLTAEQHPDVAALPELHRRLTERGIRVSRFARVASPSRGTTLASRRLDAYASLLLRAFQLIPVLRETGVAALVRKFLLAVLETRTDPRVLPGIEAMMPSSPLVRMLNTTHLARSDGLASIAGDAEGAGVARRVLVGLTDVFYGGANDFVVDTASMTHGVLRDGAQVAQFTGPKVSHMSYFSAQDSREALAQWLSSDEPSVPRFAPAVAARRDRGPARGGRDRSGDDTSPLVVLVPDAWGSVLVADDPGTGTMQVRWPSSQAISRYGVTEVLGGGKPGRAVRLVDAYGGLTDALAEVGPVTPVPWDARQDVQEAIDAFWCTFDAAADAAGRSGATTGRPVHVVAHGAGALVVLLARIRGRSSSQPAAGADPAGQADDDWKWMRRQGGHCVLLSPPLDGAASADARLAGLDELSQTLTLLDPTLATEDLRRLWATCPGVTMQSTDVARGPAWRDLPASAPDWWGGISLVYGVGALTPTQDTANPDRLVNAFGDANVTWPQRSRPGARVWFAAGSAWAMLQDPADCAAVAALVRGARPQGLLGSAPDVGEGRAAEPWRSSRGLMLFPTDEDLGRVALHGTSAPRPVRPTLRVSVVHGDLDVLGVPVLVGTYDGTPIAGAEKRVDRMLRGALERRVLLGQYPGPAGTVATFPDETGVVQAAVLGLGDAGDVTPGRLTSAVTQAVLRVAADVMDRSADGQIEPLTVASVLIATSGPAALSVQSSVTALVNGVRRANRRLRDLGATASVGTLQIVELYEELAIEAVHAIADLAAYDGESDTVLAEPRLVTGAGSLPGQPTREYFRDEWRTVRVGALRTASAVSPDGVTPGPVEPHGPVGADGSTDDGLVALSFTNVGRAARAEQEITRSQRRLVDQLVADGITSPEVSEQLFNTLYELLLPASMKAQGRERDNIMYVVDDHAAQLPLELLATSTHDEGVVPIAVDVGVIRRLETSSFRPSARTASGTSALVIGNPPAGDLPFLPGAAAEAAAVARVLRENGFTVTELIRQRHDDTPVRPVDLLNELFAQEYRVLHIAGHGVYQPGRPASSGVVIGPGLYLTALEIAQMQAIPELVFLNCCHLATLDAPQRVVRTPEDPDWRRDRLAASISRALIDAGVRAVVAAGWAVDDGAAAAFARSFYEEMMTGRDLGVASHRARKTTYEGHRDTNTWGAYQVYGPPAFRLFLIRGTDSRSELPRSRREYSGALDRLARGAEEAPDTERDAISAQLDKLVEGAPLPWQGGAERARAARVLEQLGRYQDAVDGYRAALSRWGGKADVSTLQRLANVLAKAAVAEHATHTAAGGRPQPKLGPLDEAERILTALNELIGATPERLSLLGSTLRRRATLLTDPAERTATAGRSAQCYRQAYETHRAVQGQPDYYSGINHVVMRWLASGALTPELAELAEHEEIIGDCETAAQAVRGDFWARVTAADAELARRLVTGTLDDESTALVTYAYQTCFRAGSSRSERMTVSEHLEVISSLLPETAPETAATLRSIAEQLR